MVGCLDDLARVVNESAIINHAQLVGRENGEVIVKQYDWASFLKSYFKRQAFELVPHVTWNYITSHTFIY